MIEKVEIQKIAFAVCKAIIAHPERDQIKNLIRSYTIAEETPTFNVNKEYKFIAHEDRHQLASFLFWNKLIFNKEQFNFLDDQEKSQIEYYFNFFSDINERIILHATSIIPNLSDAINPYSERKTISNNTNRFSIDKTLEDTLVSSFLSHPSLQIINTFNRNAKYPSKEQFLNAVKIVLKYINSRNLFNSLTNLKQEIFKVFPPTLYRLVIACIMFRTSLSVMNQLLYQSFLSDKLLVLDNNNVYEIIEYKTNITGIVLNLRCVDEGGVAFLKPFDILLIKISNLYEGIYSIMDSQTSISPEDGISMRYGLRAIDGNLNYFSSLIRL